MGQSIAFIVDGQHEYQLLGQSELIYYGTKSYRWK